MWTPEAVTNLADTVLVDALFIVFVAGLLGAIGGFDWLRRR